MCRDSSVGTASRNGLDNPGIESRWGRDFPHPSTPALGHTQPPVQWVPGLFPGVKRPGRGVNYQPSSRAEVKERVDPYLYSPSGLSWPLLGRALPFALCKYFKLETDLKNISHSLTCVLFVHPSSDVAPLTGASVMSRKLYVVEQKPSNFYSDAWLSVY